MSSKDKKLVQDRVTIPAYGDEKIEEAKCNLEQMRNRTAEMIIQIKTDTEELDKDRRTREQKAKKERADKIQNEVIQSHKKNVEIDWNWQELEEKEDCKELAEDIEAQQAACKKIISDKEELIEEFNKQISEKDSSYIKQIQKMSEDIDSLIQNMKAQFMKMREQYDMQLQTIESEFDRERVDILDRNKAEIEALFNEHKTIEVQFLDKRQKEEQENAKQLEEVMSQDANKQAEQKIKLETEMQILEKCMEDMKAVYRLNQEKLGFNYDVLNERQQVYLKQMKGLKQKFQRDQARLRDEDALFNHQQAEAKSLNMSYTKDYKLFTNEFIKLQKRFEKFEKADDHRIKEIWSMNDQEARNLVEKIMHADKVIHLQQLSIKWDPPRDPFFSFLSESNAVAGDSSFKGADSATQGNSVMNQNTSIMDSQGDKAQGQSKSELVDDQQSHGTKNENNTREKYERMKQVFHFLIKEAPYLIDDKSYERSQEVGGKESLKIKIDAVRKSLGIEEMADVELLVEVLYKYQDKHEAAVAEDQKRMEAEEDEEDRNNPDGNPNSVGHDPRRTSNEATINANGEQASHEEEEIDVNKLRLDAELLTPALKDFHKEREERDLRKEYMNQKNNKKSSKDSKSTDKNKDAELKKKKEKLYWSHMTQILTDQKLSVWKALDKSLSSYYQLLVDRQNLIEETGMLNQQNEELKTLLNQYLQAGVNQELQVPPTQVIRLDI